VKVELEKSFPMPGSAEVTWEFLQNIEAVAGCMPGAKITERLDDGRFKGTVTVKIGPATMSFRGEVQVRDIDPGQKSLALLAKGTDSTGTSGASMDLKARVESAGDATSSLIGNSEVSMSGKAAAFGGRMMNSVAEQLMQQFAANFAAQVAALSERRAAAQAPTGSAPAFAPLAPVATELNGLALAWAVFKGWLRSLFTRKAA
jgi:carbon monoxide dehydrogenase subunit G